MEHARIQTTARYLHHRAQRDDAALFGDAFRPAASAVTVQDPAPD